MCAFFDTKPLSLKCTFDIIVFSIVFYHIIAQNYSKLIHWFNICIVQCEWLCGISHKIFIYCNRYHFIILKKESLGHLLQCALKAEKAGDTGEKLKAYSTAKKSWAVNEQWGKFDRKLHYNIWNWTIHVNSWKNVWGCLLVVLTYNRAEWVCA